MNARRRLLLVPLVITGLLTAACGGGGVTGSASGQETPRRGGNLVLARPTDSQNFDFTGTVDNESIWPYLEMAEPLVTASKDGKTVEPCLATSWERSSDGLTWTFHLRKGVLFSDGKPMTSADVKFSLDLARNPKSTWAFVDAAISQVQAPDPGTVVVKTSRPWAPLLGDMALFANAVIPKDFGGQSQKAFFQHPIGTGPFAFGSWTRGQSLKLVRNPHYWQAGKPYLDSVTYTTVSDDNTRALQLRGGQAQVIEQVPTAQIAALQKTPGFRVDLFPSTRTDYVIMNEKHKPFDDVHVRRAISYAVDRKAIVKAVLFGYGTVADSMFMPTVPYYDGRVGAAQFDLAKARQELAASSVPHGFTAEFLVGSGDQVQMGVAQVIQGELAPLGIKVRIRTVDPSQISQYESAGHYDMRETYWTMDIPDPDEFVSFEVDPSTGANSNNTWYDNPAAVALARKAQSTFDDAERARLYSQLQKTVAQDAFEAWLAYSPYRYAESAKVHGFEVYPTGNAHLENTWLSR